MGQYEAKGGGDIPLFSVDSYPFGFKFCVRIRSEIASEWGRVARVARVNGMNEPFVVHGHLPFCLIMTDTRKG